MIQKEEMLALVTAGFGERTDCNFILGVIAQVVSENVEMPTDELLETLYRKLESLGYEDYGRRL